MEFADDGDLQNRLQEQQLKNKLFSEEDILKMFTQICLGLKHAHDRKILHRDLKSANIFMCKDGLVKLGDFGVSTVIDRTIS